MGKPFFEELIWVSLGDYNSLMVLSLSCGRRWAGFDKCGKGWDICTLRGGSRVCWARRLSLWVCHGPQDASITLIVVFCCVMLVWTKCARYLLCTLKIPLHVLRTCAVDYALFMCKRSLILYIVGSTDDTTLGAKIRGGKEANFKSYYCSYQNFSIWAKSKQEIKLPKHRFPWSYHGTLGQPPWHACTASHAMTFLFRYTES